MKLYNEKFSDFRHVHINDYNSYNLLCNIDKEKLKNIVSRCDVVVTHHIPNWEKVPNKFKLDWATSFFYFDGYELIKECKDKTWVYGHTHEQQYNVYNDCTFICNPMGYRGEFFDLQQNHVKFPRMIRSYEN
jgi:predicted phosphodiesterase